MTTNNKLPKLPKYIVRNDITKGKLYLNTPYELKDEIRPSVNCLVRYDVELKMWFLINPTKKDLETLLNLKTTSYKYGGKVYKMPISDPTKRIVVPKYVLNKSKFDFPIEKDELNVYLTTEQKMKLLLNYDNIKILDICEEHNPTIVKDEPKITKSTFF